MFRGAYQGKQYHESDLHRVLRRAKTTGVERIIATAGTLEDSIEAIALVQKFDASGTSKSDAGDTQSETEKQSTSTPALFTTVGVHPTRCDVFENSGDAEAYFQKLLEHAAKHSGNNDDNDDSSAVSDSPSSSKRVVAIGECGLDYDRLQFCGKDTQVVWFERQFELSRVTQLPMFLHSRAAHADFFQILKRMRSEHELPPCVVHSFDGSVDELNDLLTLPDVYIGINGCSLRTEESLEVVNMIPSDRMMAETDAPWCAIRNTHPGMVNNFVTTKWQSKDKKKMYKELEGCTDVSAVQELETSVQQVTVKDRCEPCHIVQVVEVLAAVRGEDPETLAEACRANTMKVFFPNDGN